MECPVPCPWRRRDWALETGEHAVPGRRIGTVDYETEDGDGRRRAGVGVGDAHPSSGQVSLPARVRMTFVESREGTSSPSPFSARSST